MKEPKRILGVISILFEEYVPEIIAGKVQEFSIKREGEIISVVIDGRFVELEISTSEWPGV
jgi:hypothetical protein